MSKIKVEVIQENITNLDFYVDAIVSATNRHLKSKKGVSGAILGAGGNTVVKACKEIIEEIKYLDVGEAVATNAGNLNADYVIHTVGPKFSDNDDDFIETKGDLIEMDKYYLGESYKNSLIAADELGCSSIAFPCISTGAFRFPKSLALEQAIQGIKEGIETGLENIEEIYFVCYDDENYNLYVEELDRIKIEFALSESSVSAPELSKAFNNTVGIFADGEFSIGQYLKKDGKIYTLGEVNYFIVVPEWVNKGKLSEILQNKGIDIAVYLDSRNTEKLFKSVLNVEDINELHIFDLTDIYVKEAFITSLVVSAPALIDLKFKPHLPLMLLSEIKNMKEIVIENDIKVELEEDFNMSMDIWGDEVVENEEKSDNELDFGCHCSCGCNDDGCDLDYDYNEDETIFEGEEDDMDLFGDVDDEDYDDESDEYGDFDSLDGIDDESGSYFPFTFEKVDDGYESPSEKIGAIVTEMVEKVESDSILDLEIEVSKDFESGLLKVEIEFLVD